MSSGNGQGSMWGTIIGGILGAIVGALTYGTGSYFGYAAGFAIGSAIGGVAGYMIDPPAMAPDSQAMGAPRTQELMGTTAQDGLPVPDLVGITKCGGNLMGYWANRAVETTETYDGGGGKGGGDSEKVTQVTGHEYYLTWAMGLCLGPVDNLLAIYRKEVCVWHGSLDRPISGGFRTLVIEDIGRINFYYGTDDQARDTRLNEMVGAANNPAYRGLCYVVFVDCCLGNYNRLPEFWFVIHKRPTYAWSALGEIYENYNPAHALYYTLTELAGVDPAYINEDSFTAAAATLSAEHRGLSCYYDRQTSAGSYIDTILTHMRGLLRYGADGLFHVVLIRRETGAVSELNADELATGLKLTRPSAVEVKNEIKVQFTRLVYEKGMDLWSRGYREPGEVVYYPDKSDYTKAPKNTTWVKQSGAADVSFSFADNRLSFSRSSAAAGSIDLTQVTDGWLTSNWSFEFRVRAVNGWGGWWNIGAGAGNKICFLTGSPSGISINNYLIRDGLQDTAWHKVKVVVRSVQSRCDLYFDKTLVEADIPYPVQTLSPTLNNGYLVFWIHWSNSSGVPPALPANCSFMIDDVLIRSLAPDFDEEIAVVRDEAGQRGLGKVCQSTVKAGMFNSIADAVWLGETMLRAAIYPAAQVTIQGRRELMQYETGDLFDLTYTPYGLAGRRFRVTGMEEADLSSEAITLHAVEDTDELMSEIAYDQGRILTPFGLHVSSGIFPDPPEEIPPEVLAPSSAVMIMEPPYIPGFLEGRRNVLAVAVGRETGTEDAYSVGISEDGASYVGAGTGRQFCVHGVLRADYPAATLKIDDTVGLLLEVPWDADRIETISRSRAIAGGNLALIGTELVSFETFTPTENENEYLALGVVRALFDTEPKGHAAGDDFYWLNDPPFIHLVENSMAVLGAEPYLKVLTFGPDGTSTVTLAEAIEQSVTGGLYERSLCPYPPANLVANGMAKNARYASDVSLSWRTRTRGTGCGIGDPDYVVDTEPAWEGTFTVTVVVGAVTVRTVTGIDDDSWTYTEAMNLADNGSLASEITFQVRGDLDVNHHSEWKEILVKKE
jgi:hypothetical protein